MTTFSISTAAATAPLFDLPPISAVAPNIGQQAAAPFSDLLQQAQAPQPAPPAPQQPSEPAADSPPQHDDQRAAAPPSDHAIPDRTPHESAGDTTASTGDNANAADHASAANQADANTADTQGRSQDSQAAPNTSNANASAHDITARQATKSGARGKAPSGKTAGADGKKLTTTVDRTAAHANVAAQAVAAVKPDTAGKQSKDDAQQNSKAAETKTSSDSAAAQPASASVPAAAATAAAAVQPVAQIVAELPTATSAAANSSTSTPTSSSTSNQPAIEAKSALGDKSIAKEIRAVAGRSQLQSVTAANQAKSKPQTLAKVSLPGAAATEEQAHQTVQSSGPLAVSASTTTKSAPSSPISSHADTSTGGVSATNTLIVTAVQAVATVAVNPPEVVSSITVDQSKSGDTTIAQSAADAAPPPPPANPSSSSPLNTPSANPSVFATSLPHGPTSETSAGNGLSTLDRSRFVQRVTRAFQTAGDQGGQIRLRLSPPELGSLQVQISVKQGALTAHIQADNSTAQQVLLDSLPELRDRLSQQDIRIERFEVELSGQSSGGLPQSPQGNAGFDQTDRRLSPARNTPAGAITPDNTETGRAAPLSVNGALNVVV